MPNVIEIERATGLATAACQQAEAFEVSTCARRSISDLDAPNLLNQESMLD